MSLPNETSEVKPGFTPGPWWRGDALGCKPRMAICNHVNMMTICKVTSLLNSDAGDANANLLAAAPDLYEALLAVITPEHDGGRPVLVEGECSEFDSVLAKVRAALAKAVAP